MSTYTETVADKLNDILEKTYDAEKGYKKAAENTDNLNLRTFFLKKSNQRKDFGQALKTEIDKFGEEADKGGSAAGALHRAWMDTKAFFSSDEAESMLEESIRGEKAAVNEYEDVLNDTNLPTSTATVLRQQLNAINNDLNKIKRLEDLS
ncbi:Hypothetical protein I595_1777 [Croceitalea dokdonensis DOKDO 023]|uniref:DUF2383 domain-containing protein n=1 Tax=Croceitalea dokdonensis DOKDO 023 TaxID=1300341 RepID=A0A0P7A621_9FLAO|nr:PA2169 family four-helix-bundle protein [Croceitalea dokdonensis]KPM32128.1 Hypothetical protein I595_1777 [Croceitalea dokdonensis DOKDO 023]